MTRALERTYYDINTVQRAFVVALTAVLFSVCVLEGHDGAMLIIISFSMNLPQTKASTVCMLFVCMLFVCELWCTPHAGRQISPPAVLSCTSKRDLRDDVPPNASPTNSLKLTGG